MRPSGVFPAAVLLMMAAMILWVIAEIVGFAAMRDIPIPELVWLRYVIHLG